MLKSQFIDIENDDKDNFQTSSKSHRIFMIGAYAYTLLSSPSLSMSNEGITKILKYMQER